MEGLLGRDHVRRRLASRSADRRRRGAGLHLCRTPRRGRTRGDSTVATTSRCAARLRRMRRRFNDTFWDPRGWFVLGLDGRGWPIDALASNPGHALWTGIADDELALRYLEHLERRVDVDGLGDSHTRLDDGCVRPAELSQRLGLAARHGALRRRRRSVRALGPRRSHLRRRPRRRRPLRRSPARTVRRVGPNRRAGTGGLPGVVFTAGVVVGQRAVSVADVARAAAGCRRAGSVVPAVRPLLGCRRRHRRTVHASRPRRRAGQRWCASDRGVAAGLVPTVQPES